jgi:hypothetical protein
MNLKDIGYDSMLGNNLEYLLLQVVAGDTPRPQYPNLKMLIDSRLPAPQMPYLLVKGLAVLVFGQGWNIIEAGNFGIDLAYRHQDIQRRLR